MSSKLYDPSSADPFRLSRTKLQLFLDCPRCFVLDRRHGIKRPEMGAFSLHLAIDALMKREFDHYRATGEPHPVMRLHGLELVPYKSPQLEIWRDALRGVSSVHQPSQIELYGAVDDVWADARGELFVVDYKATSTGTELSLRDPKFDKYKRQLEVYRWLIMRNGMPTSRTAYLLFANADRSRESFDRTLEFRYSLLPHECEDEWIEPALSDAKHALDAEVLPPSTQGCVWCKYRREVKSLQR